MLVADICVAYSTQTNVSVSSNYAFDISWTLDLWCIISTMIFEVDRARVFWNPIDDERIQNVSVASQVVWSLLRKGLHQCCSALLIASIRQNHRDSNETGECREDYPCIYLHMLLLCNWCLDFNILLFFAVHQQSLRHWFRCFLLHLLHVWFSYTINGTLFLDTILV